MAHPDLQATEPALPVRQIDGRRWALGRRKFVDAALAAARDNVLLLAITFGYAITVSWVQAIADIPVGRRPPLESLTTFTGWAVRLSLAAVVLSAFVFPFFRIKDLLRARRARGSVPPSPRESWRAFALRPSLRRFLRTLVALLAFALFTHMFIGFKGSIALLNPFAWDERFMRLDQLIHLGHDPWRLLHLLAGNAAATGMLDLLYYVWFPVKIVGVLWFAWMADGPERRHFFLAFFLVWIVLGNVAALIFSSAGPCYFDLATGGLGPYGELMEYLRGVDAVQGLTALEIQTGLRESFTANEISPAGGITAMPSIHVALPFLFALATWQRNRVIGWLFVAFGAVTLMGSVHLGWHYAVDGYASIIGVVLIWWVTGKIVRRWSSGEEEGTAATSTGTPETSELAAFAHLPGRQAASNLP